MKQRHLVLALALILAGWFSFGAGGPPPPSRKPAAAGTRSTPSATPQPVVTGMKPETTILPVLAREAWADATPAQLFMKQSWAPPPPPPSSAPPPPPPSAPPLPFLYIGKKHEEGQWEAYLARRNQIIVVNEQSIVDNVYRVESIRPGFLSLMYLPLKQLQTLSTGGSE
jgi:hypothetical protein